MKRLPFVLALGALVGCGYDFDTFSDDYLVALCDKLEECEFFTADYTKDDCLNPDVVEDTSGADPWECEEFDADAAQACLDEIEAVSCEDYTAGTGYASCTSYCSNM